MKKITVRVKTSKQIEENPVENFLKQQEEKTNSKNLSYIKYIEIKNEAYNIVSYFNSLTMQGKFEFIENCIKYPEGSEEYMIFLTTLLIPNDLQFINVYKNEKRSSELAKFYQVPQKLIFRKCSELGMYELEKLLNLGLIDKNLASQSYDWTKEKTDDIDDLMSLFGTQPFLVRQRIEHLDYEQRIQNRLNNITKTK